MRVLLEEEDVRFEPFTVSMTFESPEEASAIFALFNYGPLVNLLEKELPGVADRIRELIKQGIARDPRRSLAVLDYGKLHDEMRKRFSGVGAGERGN